MSEQMPESWPEDWPGSAVAEAEKLTEQREELLDALRECAKTAEDDRQGVQAHRLVSIANRAHSAIEKAS